MDEYRYRESDIDMKRVEELLRTKTGEQLHAEWEAFKKKFFEEHPEMKKK